MATARLVDFATGIARARDLVGLGQAVGSMTVGRVDATDIYRAGLVQAVSALDHYFHGVVLDRAVDMILSRSAATGATSKIGVSFNAMRSILAAPTPADQELLARTYVSQRLSLETFQKADDIASALSMVGVPGAWALAFGASAGPTKVALGVVVTRRNRIVHQSDSDPLTPGALTVLTDTDALSAIATVESIVNGLDPHC